MLNKMNRDKSNWRRYLKRAIIVIYVIQAVLLISGKQLIEFSQIDNFVQFGFVQFCPNGAGDFGVGDFGPIKALKRHRGRRDILLSDGFRWLYSTGKTRRRWRRGTSKRRWRRRWRHFRILETLAPVHEISKAGRWTEIEVFEPIFSVVRNAGPGVIEDVLQFHLILLDHLQLLAELVKIRFHVGDLLLGLHVGNSLALKLFF